jgi:hypothetical protein
MSRELIYTKKGNNYVGAIIEVNHRELTSDDYGRIYARFSKKVRMPAGFANMVTLDERTREGSIYWSEGLARGGCVFTLYCLPGTEPKDIQKLKDRLRRTRDVEAVYTVKIDQIIPYNHTTT